MEKKWKVTDYWGLVKSRSYVRFSTAKKGALELCYKQKCMLRISHPDKKGYCFIKSNGDIGTFWPEEWKDVL
jgi:hypothetical protein